jgi:hypothetical protein
MPRDKHWIGLDDATLLTANWRKKNPKAPKAMRFSATAVQRILQQPGCKGVRIYYAQHEDKSWTMVLVGTDTKGRDMTKGEIAQEGIPCPPDCDPKSPLGSGN